jgi:hypothetical protein
MRRCRTAPAADPNAERRQAASHRPEVLLHQIAHRHLWLAVAVGRVNHDAAIDPQAAQRGSEVAAEIDLGYVIDPDPSGDVEDARGDILLPVKIVSPFTCCATIRAGPGAGTLVGP